MTTSFVQTSSAQGLRVIRDAEIETAIRDMAEPVFEQAGFSRDSIRIVLVDNSALNAFVAGGHNIFIHTGLILRAENPEELLGVLAHELSHIASGHLVRTHAISEGLSFQTMLTAIIGIAAAIGTGSGDAGAAILAGGQAAALTQYLKHSRTQEASADHGAISYLNGAGISPRGLLSFMQKLENEELLPPSQQSEYVQTHPLTSNRIRFLQHAVEKSRYKDTASPRIWHQNFARIKGKLTGYLLPEQALRLTDKTSIPAIYARSIGHYRKGQTEQAIKDLDSLLEKEPQNPYFNELKGQILFENGDVDQGALFYGRAVEFSKSVSLINIDYAHVLIEKARGEQAKEQTKAMKKTLDTAISMLQQAKKAEQLNPRLYHFLAIAYGIDGQEGYARLNLAEEAVLKNALDVAQRQLSYADANLPKDAAQARLRMQDLKQLIEQRKAKQKK